MLPTQMLRRAILATTVLGFALAGIAQPVSAAAPFVTVSIQSPAAGATVFGTITVSGTAAAKAGVSIVGVAVDSSPFHAATGTTSWTYALDTNTLAAGSHTIIAQASDARGRLATTSVSVNVNNAPPAITISSPAAGAVVSGNVSVSGTASSQAGVASVQVQVDSSAWAAAAGTTSWSATVASAGFADGTHTISAKATDSVGHSSTTSVSVTFSNSSPSVSISSPQSGAAVAGSITVSGSASSLAGIATVQVQVDSGAPVAATGTTSWSTPVATTSYADGTHTISAIATDGFGRSSTASVSVTFSNAPPSVAITSPQPSATLTGTVTVAGSASSVAGITSVQVQVDAGAFAAATGTASWSASINTAAYANGTHTISAVATDSLGRTTTTSISVTFSNQAATHQSPWFIHDSTGNVSTVNETMNWDGNMVFNEVLPTGTITLQVNSTIAPNDANPADTCSQDAVTGYWSCVHTLQTADFEWNSVIGWESHYAFQLQVEYPPTSTFTISYSGDSNFAPSSGTAAFT